MIDRMLEPLIVAIRGSELVQTLHSIKADGGMEWALAGELVRPLTQNEIQRLIDDGNSADDWRWVMVAEGFRPGRVLHSRFHGHVTLGRFEEAARGPGGVTLPSGVIGSTISDCVIGHNAIVQNVACLASYVVGERACVSDCGRVVCTGPTTFGNGIRIPIGPQCGGRWLHAFAEITLDVADHLLQLGTDGSFARRCADLFAEYLDRVRSSRGVIGSSARVTHVPIVQNAYVGAAAELDAATRIDNATILSSREEPAQVRDGARVCDSVLQWGVQVTGPAVVERTVLLEHSQVEPFGKIIDSVLAPNSAVGGAEVIASLVGPFVGCHHQGLLIAARWTAGRGNLGYGAAIGCNHTSRAPDQEAVLGEGVFIGLGAKIQYPSDLSRSPYSVLGSGVSLPPQKIAFPFSLVRPATESLPGMALGTNLLVPAWTLSENLYAVQRSMIKFRTRNRARRHRLDSSVFRPEILALVRDALSRLERPEAIREFYTEAEIPGLGRNALLERHRVAAIRCYTEHLDRVRLLWVLERAVRGLAADRSAAFHLLEVDGPEAWPDLSRLTWLLESYGRAVESSKARDEERGALIIDDYACAHEPTRDDPIVRQTWEEIREIQDRLSQVLAAFNQHPGSAAVTHAVGNSVLGGN